MAQVFVSYARENHDFALRLAGDIQTQGLSVWIDTGQIIGGEDWEEKIYEGLLQAELVIACLSPQSIESKWARREVFLARFLKKRIVPVMLEDCQHLLNQYDETKPLERIHYVDFIPGYEQGWDQLQRAFPARARGAGEEHPFRGLKDSEWDSLLRKIRDQKCTPFIGPNACKNALLFRARVAREWTERYHYPFADSMDLPYIAQYLATAEHPSIPSDELREIWSAMVEAPDFEDACQTYATLARLPFSTVITTNYHPEMERALAARQITARHEFCRWNRTLQDGRTLFDLEPEYEPQPGQPLVYHLLGQFEHPESLVISEDDYLTFLVSVTRDEKLLPPPVQQALTNTSLLFLGYRVNDWEFRVLFRSIASFLEKNYRSNIHVSVQLEPESERVRAGFEENARKYLETYFDNHKIRIYWGECQEFVTELGARWEAYQRGQ